MKLRQLQESELLLDRWEEEKEEYRLENEQLKVQLQVRNMEDEKLRIWQESIQKMVHRVEKSIDSEGGRERGVPKQRDEGE